MLRPDCAKWYKLMQTSRACQESLKTVLEAKRKNKWRFKVSKPLARCDGTYIHAPGQADMMVSLVCIASQASQNYIVRSYLKLKPKKKKKNLTKYLSKEDRCLKCHIKSF